MSKYKTPEQKRRFYDSPSWRSLRRVIVERDNFECQQCKRNGLVVIDTNEYSETAKRKKIQLVVHHIRELERYPELALEISNLETICVACHEKEHKRMPMKNEKVNKWKNDERW
ncbi:HNH endonuclease [Paenibacillus glycanilyticus]|uniref:HNH endonuclease n=1 Tax=Paenibacillus glycanilyticus TaxID=126569 RepID=UPI00203BA58F|nr:HNH endonuclease [Paenibacillus glycanilyticus]MCM3628793.1 HNH endonuclease [Paenibacillus glycanilyticus]